ncbi:MAG: hypothetical protein FWG00_01375 [Coriobacteriia bacterium]|nr:hypothetical protein [Coriobacteriia bacterium]
MRFTLRLDRLWLPGWILACIVFAISFIPVLPSLVGDEQMLNALQETMSSPAVIAMCGMMYGDEYTFGVMYTQMMFVWSALVVGVMNIFLVNRHTRSNEEEGRSELLGSLPLGKAAPLASLTIIVLGANVLIALGIAVCMPAFNMESIDVAGSLVYGAGIGGIGLIFAALTMVFAQVCSTSKSTIGFSFAALGIAYLLRAVGDMGADAATNPLGFISPFGLGERTFPFYENLWWPLGVMVLAAAVLIALAFVLNARRDQGAGLLQARRGKAHGSRFLISQISLSLRLLRGTIIAWALVMLILGACYGLVFNDLSSFYDASPTIQAVLGIVDGVTGLELLKPVIGTLTMMMATIAVVPVVIIVNQLQSEERRGRLEVLFGTASSKIIALLSYTIIAAVCALVFQLLVGLGMWAGALAVMDNPPAFEIFIKTALNTVPPILVFVGLAVLLVGVAPKLSPMLWVFLAYAFLMVYFGSVVDIPEWAIKISPFMIVANYPEEAFRLAPWLALTGVFVVLSAVGIIAYRLRDIKA